LLFAITILNIFLFEIKFYLILLFMFVVLIFCLRLQFSIIFIRYRLNIVLIKLNIELVNKVNMETRINVLEKIYFSSLNIYFFII
jgi:hypothetical protein